MDLGLSFTIFKNELEWRLPMTSTTAGRNMQYERNRQGFSVAQMASDLSIAEETLIKYEDGTIPITEADGLKIAEYLSIVSASIGIEPILEDKPIPKNFFSLFKPGPKKRSWKQAWKEDCAQFKKSFDRRSKKEKMESLENILFHPEKMSKENPFMFVRIGLSLLLIYILATAIQEVTLMLLSLSLLVPFTLLWYLFEKHVLRSVSGFEITKLFLIGGLISICLVIMIRNYVGYPQVVGLAELLTGIVEETAKIACVVIFVRRIKLTNTISGMLVGFAIGAGFSVFETAMYGMAFFTSNDLNISVMEMNTMLRSLYSLFGCGHHFWTGLLSGALVAVSKTGYVKLKELKRAPAFFTFLLVIAFHTLFNYSLNFTWGIVIRVAICIVSLLCFVLMWRRGVIQYHEAEEQRIEKEQNAAKEEEINTVTADPVVPVDEALENAETVPSEPISDGTETDMPREEPAESSANEETPVEDKTEN